jgi:hypothetical protein
MKKRMKRKKEVKTTTMQYLPVKRASTHERPQTANPETILNSAEKPMII